MRPPSIPSTARTAGTLRTVLRVVIKIVLTVGAFYLLLTHHVPDEQGNRMTKRR